MVELAEKVRLSHTPCWRRVKRLESDGVIKERAVILDAGKLGLSINVYAQVRLRQHDEETPNALGAPRGLPVGGEIRARHSADDAIPIAAQKNAWISVIALPRINVCTSCVPS